MSKVEKTKVQSAGLFWVSGKGERHSFASEIDDMSRGDAETLSGGAADLSKHFGIYKQQERIDGRKNGPYIFMLRLKCPSGGEISPEQWAALDEASDRFADGTLRLTTRQSVQYHHITGKNLGPLVRFLNESYRDRGYQMSTLGACGDVNRNTMCSPPGHPGWMNATSAAEMRGNYREPPSRPPLSSSPSLAIRSLIFPKRAGADVDCDPDSNYDVAKALDYVIINE